MKRFHFPLRPVAVLRAHRQARAREAFAASVHAYVLPRKTWPSCTQRRGDPGAVMHDGRRETFKPADEISFCGAYRLVCEDEVKSERSVIEARAAMEERRQDYMEAHRAVKVVEKLELKARNEYRLETAREAQLELDELAGFRVARRLAASTVTSHEQTGQPDLSPPSWPSWWVRAPACAPSWRAAQVALDHAIKLVPHKDALVNEERSRGWNFWTIEIENLANELKGERDRLHKQGRAARPPRGSARRRAAGIEQGSAPRSRACGRRSPPRSSRSTPTRPRTSAAPRADLHQPYAARRRGDHPGDGRRERGQDPLDDEARRS